MHIGLDARLVYYRRYSGIGQYIAGLADRLAGLDPDVIYTIIHSRKDRNPPHHPASRLFSAWTPSHNRLEQLTLPIELGRLQLDLLHSPDFIPPFHTVQFPVHTVQFPVRGHFKRVITVHDLNFLYYPQFLTAESRRYYNGQIERAVSIADHILADSYATRIDLVKLLSVPDSKISVVWLAPGEAYRPLSPEALTAARARLHLPDRFILFTGTLEPRKNVAGLLQAYRRMLDRDAHQPDLILAGSRGWLFEDTRTLAARLHLSDHVRWIESPSQADLVALYNAATVFALPSYYEGFGLTVLEAMACGTPTLIGDRGSLPEIAGDAALIVNPDDFAAIADALERVFSDETSQAVLRRKGFARVQEFSWERCARETLAVYHRVVGIG